MKDVIIIVDLQFGSTGKGQIAGTIGRKWHPDTTVCANGPNAGHTYKWWEGRNPESLRQVVHTVLPVTSVLPSVRNILLGPGAVIDIDKLEAEVLGSVDLLRNKRIIIHPNASIVSQVHRDREKNFIGIGSTMKGTAEAVIEKMRRLSDAPIAKYFAAKIERLFSGTGVSVNVAEGTYSAALDSSVRLLVEGAQGASLSIHSSFYPHCTSRDVSINQIWADCRLPARTSAAAWAHKGEVQIVGVCRTYPIRVANRVDPATGFQLGYSGGCYSDQKEILWQDIGREPELTTVTKLPRRLFTFSTQQILESCRYNAPTSIALTFCDYLPSHNEHHPDIPEGMMPYPVGPGEKLSPCVHHMVKRIEAAAGCSVDFLSFGPTDTDIYNPTDTDIYNPTQGWDSRSRLSTEFRLPRSWEAR